MQMLIKICGIGLFLCFLLAGCDELPVEGPRAECANAGGEWRELPNSCVDSCDYRRGNVEMCAQVITEGCDCGENRCWNGTTCVDTY